MHFLPISLLIYFGVILLNGITDIPAIIGGALITTAFILFVNKILGQ